MPTGRSVSGRAIEYVTSGTYQRVYISSAAQSFTAGTEVVITAVSDNIDTTADKDALYSWVRGEVNIHNTAGPIAFEWMLLRQAGTEATPDLSDASVVEILQRDKRILARGMIFGPDSDYGRTKSIKFAKYKLYLPAGEELRLILRPIVTIAGTINHYGLLEWREVGA